MKPKPPQIVAVLSTTVLPLDGTYKVETATACPDITGVPHYIGHPDTRAIVEELGAVQAESKLFPGLQPGEKAVCFPIRQGESTRKDDGFSSPHQAAKLEDLQVRVVQRIDAGPCIFCGATTYYNDWHCPGCGAT